MKQRSDNELIERAFGKIALLEERVDQLIAEREHDAQQLRFLEAQMKRAGQMPEMLNERDAAKLLGVSLRTLQYWRAEGRITFTQCPMRGGVRYSREDLQGFVLRHGCRKRSVLKAA